MNREQFFTRLADHFHVDELQYIQRAYWLVKEAHRRQRRRLTGERYFEHLRRVAFVFVDPLEHYDSETVTLALLHDVIEDTYVPPSVVANLFGQLMYNWTLGLSKEHPSFNVITGKLIGRTKISDDAYYGALGTAGIKPRRVKGADRYDNLADLAQWEPARREKYIIETNKYVLPIIENTDLRLHQMIVGRLNLANTSTTQKSLDM